MTDDGPPVLSMRSVFHTSITCLFPALYGMLLIGGLFGMGPPAHASLPERPTPATIQPQVSSQNSSTSPPVQDATPSIPEESEGESVLEVLLGILIFGPIITILLGLLLAFPTVLLAVSLVMDGGCLRFILFGMGWLCAIFYGLLTGAIIGEAVLGLEFLVKPIIYVFMWGYPIAAYWGYKKLQAMPDEQYRAWDQTLTGGALLGFGAGSIAGLFRSAASGFGGFGGGSFGGGGASGSWSGASGAAASTSSPAAGGVSATAPGSTATASGGSAQAAAVVAGAAPGVETESLSSASSIPASSNGFWRRLQRWFQKFQWYHGLAFVLVTLVFVPFGLGAMQALQNTKVFVFVLVSAVLFTGYKLFRRYADSTQSVSSTLSSFRGGEASSSWS